MTMGDLHDLKKRIKALLQEPENMKCSECRNKKKGIKFFSLLQTPERGQLGVFCCKDCHEFHLALGADYATVKSIKKPEEWTEEDVATLEKSGNKAVNAIYESGLEGNHTDKHMGALASAAFVDMKYKQCVYFSEKALEEQLQLRAMIQFAKDGVPREQPKPLSMEDRVGKALKRQSMMPTHSGKPPLRASGGSNSNTHTNNPAATDGGEVLLRGFGASPTKDDNNTERKPRRTSGRMPTTSDDHEEKRGSGSRRPMRKSKTWDGTDPDIQKISQRRGGKKPDNLPPGSTSRRGGPRSGGAARRGTEMMGGENYDKRSFRRSKTAEEVPRRSQRSRRASTMEGPETTSRSHRGQARGHRRASTMEGPSAEGGGNPRLRRTNTGSQDRGHRGSGGSGPGLRRAQTSTDARSSSRPGDRLAKRSGGGGGHHGGRHSRSRSGDDARPKSSRGERRSVSPTRGSRGSPQRGKRGENRSLSPTRVTRKRSPGPNGSTRSFNNSSRSSFDSDEQQASNPKKLLGDSAVISDDDSLLDESEVLSPRKNEKDKRESEKNEESWMEQIEGVTWSRSSAKELIEESLGNVMEKKKKRSSSKEQIEVDPTDSQHDNNLSWTEQVDGVTWSRSSAKGMIENAPGKKRGSARRQMLVDAGENLEQAIPAFHRQQNPTQDPFANPDPFGDLEHNNKDIGKDSVTQKKRRESSSTAEMSNQEQDSKEGADTGFATDAFGSDAFGASDAFGTDDAFGTSFTNMGFGDFSASSNGLDDEDDACLLGKGIALSSQ